MNLLFMESQKNFLSTKKCVKSLSKRDFGQDSDLAHFFGDGAKGKTYAKISCVEK